MRRTYVSELSVLVDHDRAVARMPTTLELGAAWFHLERPGRSHRLVGRLHATRFEGSWRMGRHAGTWRVDVVPARPHGSLLSVVVERWRRRGGDDLAFALARSLRDRMEQPLLGRRTIENTEGEVLVVPLWETAPV